MSTIAGLRAATWASHQRLEKRLDINARFANRATYRAHLEHMWGFCSVLESRVEHPLRGVLADIDSRRKLPLLTRDLIALGVDPEDIDGLPRCSGLPTCEDAAESFGCLYVMEGATLGGQTLLPLAAKRLSVTATEGASFLASYGEAVSSMWRTFGQALDAYCAEPADQTRAASAAVATFISLDRWLCAEPS